MKDNMNITWDDISIRQYLDIMDISVNEKNELLKMSKLIQVIFNLDMENISMLKALDYQNSVRELMASAPEIKPVQKKYKIGSFNCYVTDFDKMTMAQFMDFQGFADKGEDHLVDTLVTCLVPIGHKYNDGYDIDELREAILEMPITIGPSICSFFQKRLKKLLNSSLHSLALKILMSKGTSWKKKMILLKTLPTVQNSLDYFIM